MSVNHSRDEFENTFYNERSRTSLLKTFSSNESCWDSTNLKFLFAIRAALVGSIGGLLLGYDLGVMSGALPALADEYNLSINQQELLTSLMLVGCVFGACVGGFICDGIGRKRTVYAVCVLFLLGAIIMSSARSLNVLYLGRIIVGFGVSISAIVDVSYLTEISPPEFRGSVVGTNELMITVGILLAFCIDYKFSQLPEGWRYMFAFPAVLAVMWAILMCMMPESPRWLLVKGRPEEALRVFSLIEGGSKEEATREFEKASAVVEASRVSSSKSLYKIITEDWRLSMILAVSLMVLQHFSGHGSIIAYAPTIFARVGLGASSAGVATILLGIIKVAFTLLSLIAVDFVGRRALLLSGIFGMAVSLVVLCATFQKMASTSTPSRAEEIVAVTAVCTLVASYAVGFGPVTWLIASELFPDEIRGRTMGIATVANWVANVIVIATFLSMLSTLGTVRTFSIYTCVCFFSIVFVYFLLPETRCKEVPEIQRELKLRFSIFDRRCSSCVPAVIQRAGLGMSNFGDSLAPRPRESLAEKNTGTGTGGTSTVTGTSSSSSVKSGSAYNNNGAISLSTLGGSSDMPRRTVPFNITSESVFDGKNNESGTMSSSEYGGPGPNNHQTQYASSGTDSAVSTVVLNALQTPPSSGNHSNKGTASSTSRKNRLPYLSTAPTTSDNNSSGGGSNSLSGAATTSDALDVEASRFVVDSEVIGLGTDKESVELTRFYRVSDVPNTTNPLLTTTGTGTGGTGKGISLSSKLRPQSTRQFQSSSTKTASSKSTYSFHSSSPSNSTKEKKTRNKKAYETLMPSEGVGSDDDEGRRNVCDSPGDDDDDDDLNKA